MLNSLTTSVLREMNISKEERINLVKEINKFYTLFSDEKMKEINISYFKTLYEKYQNNESIEIVINEAGKNDSHVIPFPVASEEDLNLVTIQNYENLSQSISEKLKDYELCICKMQAGLGTSVKRDDLIAKYTDRKELGSKGTDLFINYNNKIISIAEVQLLLAEKRKDEEVFKSISFQNLLNSETEKAVNSIWKNQHPIKNSTYEKIFKESGLSRKKEINQLMMPTIDETKSITFDRVAPAGHAFLGFYEILELFRNDNTSNEILVIGNGEDLKSTPDNKILSWVAENNIPVAMITTTKLKKDKKGGQLAIVKEAKPYVTIVEKAQAQRANQLELFEELGLRENDKRSLFNTNIVIINKKSLKEAFNKYLNLSEEEFISIISPDLIKNIKEQDGNEFTQLEGALGSTIVHLDKYFRQNYETPLVSFLNLAPQNRESFFMPIKKREDFDGMYE
jgi:hypothetical protein